MDSKDKKKKEPWKIAVFVLSVGYILFTWIDKDVIAIYTTMPREQIFPLIATTVGVSLLKVAVLAAGVFAVKWLIRKFSGRES